MTNYLRVLYYVFDMMRHLYLGRNRLGEYQNIRLKKMIRHAYDCVPFYHGKFKQSGIMPSDIQTVSDLSKLPIVTKDEIKKNLNGMIACQFDVNNLEQHWTSGSTGQPLFFYISKSEDDFRKAKHLRGNITCGQKPRDRWVAVVPPFRFTNTTKLQRTLGIYAPIPISVLDDSATQISIIERANPDLVDGYSSSLLLLAREVEKRELTTIKPRFLFGGAELTDDLSRGYIEKVFEAPFYDRYATVELERMAWQCPVKREYHIDADTVILEFVDGDGEAVSPGERGEIVCTSLFNYAMPFIRYAIGDVGIPSDKECSCGRTFPLMKMVEGRKDSLIVLPDGRVLSPRMFSIAMRMFELYRHIAQFRIIQMKPDLFEIHIQKKDATINEKTMETELAAHMQKMLSLEELGITFETRFVENIPLDKSGKLMAVVSELRMNR
jgi:phenylacetate-CoA ligase